MVALVFAAESTSGGTSQLVVTIIAGVAALAGAVIGGLITAVGTYRIEERKQKFQREQDEQRRRGEAERERQAAVATARAMHARYKTARRYLEVALELGHWWPKTTPRWPTSSPADLKTIAPYLDPREWWQIEDAEWVIEEAWATRQGRTKTDIEDSALAEAIAIWAKTTSGAEVALSKLAGLPATDEAPQADVKADEK